MRSEGRTARRRWPLVVPVGLLALAGCMELPGWPSATEPQATTAPLPASAPGSAAASPGPAGASAADETDFATPQRRTRFDAAAVPEVSGIAASRRVPGRAYLVDDDLGLFVLDLDTGAVRHLGVTTRGGTAPRASDVEDVAVGPCGPADASSCVYVGDIGDNRRRREAVEVWRLPEPAEPAPATAVADVVVLAYPDGPRDAEALLVDAGGRPMIITKAPFDERSGSTGSTDVLRATGFADGVLEDLGELVLPPPSTSLFAGSVGNVVTAADRAGDRVLLRTYDSVLLLDPPAGTEEVADLARWPMREVVGAPVLPQTEAVALLPDGAGYLTVSEGVGDVWQGALPAPAPQGPAEPGGPPR